MLNIASITHLQFLKVLTISLVYKHPKFIINISVCIQNFPSQLCRKENPYNLGNLLLGR